MVKKKKSRLMQEYKKSWRYLLELKNFLIVVFGIFFLAIIFGYFVPPTEAIYNQLLAYLQELIELTQGKTLLELIVFIFFNNFKNSFFGIFLGIVFGIFPIIAIFLNGYFLGFVSRLTVGENGFSVLWLLVPHGIFELPAIFISFALGLKLGTFIFQKERKKALIDYLSGAIGVFFLIVFPLLLVAAIIEGFLIFYS
jgi:stage II sporulation protein M